jgi:two-component system cell cycle response regulator
MIPELDPRQQEPSKKYPILLVEDEKQTRKFIDMLLRRSGYEVTSVADGSEAWALLQNTFYPIVLSDIRMPDMDGFELCRKIRNATFPRYVFIILLTAMDSREDVVRGLEAGADEYLIKPFDNAELVARMNTASRILNLESSLKRAYHEMVIDPMTGAYNRGFFTRRMPEEIQRTTRYHHPLSLILGDIDHFKAVNDNYGHQVGDAVLTAFVDSMQQHTRLGVDLVVRYGGEEFAIILPETDLERSLATAERIRRFTQENIFAAHGRDVRFTASFGVASYHPDKTENEPTLESMVDVADKMLYYCKENGRNQVKGEVLT